MTIDSSIYQLAGRGVKSVADYDNEAAQAQQNKLAMMVGGLKAQEMQRGINEQNQLRQLFSQPDFNVANQDSIRQVMGINPATGMSMQKSILDNKKTQADIDHIGAQSGKLNAETLNMHVAQSRDQLNNINDPQSAAAWLTAIYNNPELAPLIKMSGKTLDQQIAAIPKDPQGFADWKLRSSIGADKLVQMTMPDANAKLSAQTSLANNAANNATAQRGQNMVDARTRESTTAAMSKPFEVTGPDGAPVLVQQNKQGQIVPVTGYSPKTVADKPLTDAQSKAALFGSRMQSANQVLDSLEKDGTTTSIPGARAGFGVGAVLNTMSPAKQQQLNQAKRDFVNAVLRRESGAVISDSEFDNAEKQYFPQVGDSKEVIKQKKNNREIAIRGIQAEVPKAQRGVLKEIQGGATGDFSSGSIDALLDKYK